MYPYRELRYRRGYKRVGSEAARLSEGDIQFFGDMIDESFGNGRFAL